MAMLERQFNKLMKKVDQRPKSNGRFNNNKQSSFQKKTNEDERGVRCHECEGFGHIRTECPTFLKRQKKSLVVSWSDTDSEEEESAKFVNALTGVCVSDSESCDEEVTYEELAATYKDLHNRSIEVCKALDKQKKINGKLQAERNDLLTNILIISTLRLKIRVVKFVS
ncbi:unnamed protein product [Trifolium pratense]|uniref:Uncharacterized protein n=1 Tax=Trifolium pratense TaxID=57577 RepID=A0ACB0JPW1_TRIPR|nr:unnamed protein product [Trifolium pratense]